MKKNLDVWKKYSYLLLIGFIIGGMFDLRIGLVALVCMIGPIVVALFRGKFWCGNICPRGSFYDNILIKFSNKNKTPKFLKSKYFRVFATLLMLTVFIVGIVTAWGDLYGMGLVIYRLIVVTTIIGIILALFYNERTWCNFCPMGNIAALVAYFKNKKNKDKLLFIENTCVGCKICTKKCPMGIRTHEYKNDTIVHHDCIQCGRCVSACPKRVITLIRK